MQKSLAFILKEREEIVSQIETMEGEMPDWLIEWKQQNSKERDQKINNYAKYLETLDMEMNHAKEKARYWSDRKAVLENKKQRFKDWIKFLLNSDEKLQTESVEFKLQKGPVKVNLGGLDYSDLPAEFVEMTPKILTQKLKNEYENLPEPLKEIIKLEQELHVRMKGGE